MPSPALRSSNLFILLACLASLTACHGAAAGLPVPERLHCPPTILGPAISITASFAVTSTPTATPALTSPTIPSLTSTSSPSPAFTTCQTFDPTIARLVEQVDQASWLGWVRALSGADPVRLDGQEKRIRTRYAPVMFGPLSPKEDTAFAYVLAQLRAWYPAEKITVMDYPVHLPDQPTATWKNLVLTLPGADRADEIVILSAHLDSTNRHDRPSASALAPGADDNATGAAALLEAARVLRGSQYFSRTIQIIWFTGEEEGLLGSKAFIKARHVKEPSTTINAVVNLDMLGYDADNDHCFELHVGELPASQRAGQCFLQSLTTYSLSLHPPDYLTSGATSSSDHSSFWLDGTGAVEVLENYFDNQQPQGCQGYDRSPYYHTSSDTVEHLNTETAVRITRAALATLLGLANIVP